MNTPTPTAGRDLTVFRLGVWFSIGVSTSPEPRSESDLFLFVFAEHGFDASSDEFDALLEVGAEVVFLGEGDHRFEVFDDASFGDGEEDFAAAAGAFSDEWRSSVFVVAGDAAEFLLAELSEVSACVFGEVFFDDEACDVACFDGAYFHGEDHLSFEFLFH